VGLGATLTGEDETTGDDEGMLDGAALEITALEDGAALEEASLELARWRKQHSTRKPRLKVPRSTSGTH
jgi:hypothetical protein